MRANGIRSILKTSRLRRKLAARLVLVGAALFAALSAQAATVTGTFRYQDSNGPKPIAFARVEIWHRGIFFWNTWAHVGTTTTDSNGFLRFQDNRCDGTYGVKVFATNFAATVFPNDDFYSPFTPPFHREPGEPGPVINRSASSCSDVLDFSFSFTDSFAPQHYNIAETIRHGFGYAGARRDPSESDPIPPVNVYFIGIADLIQRSHYNPSDNALRIHDTQVFEDFLILHEYAHFLEANISSFAWIASTHDGCRATDVFGGLINSAEHAWMEGFADYFAMVVPRFLPAGAVSGNPLSGSPLVPLESPGPCSAVGLVGSSGTITPSMVENFVAASLWELFDAPGDAGAVFETHDSITRQDLVTFRILDRELDLLGRWPTIQDFHNAWVGRGLDHVGLDWSFHAQGIYPDGPNPAPCRPLTVPLKLYWSSSRGDNFTTATPQGERDALAAGYQFVRVEGCVFPSFRTGTVQLKLYWNGADADNFTLATPASESEALSAGHQFIRIEGFVFPSQVAGTVPLKLYRRSFRVIERSPFGLFLIRWRTDNFTTGTAAGEADALAASYQFVRNEGFVFPN